MCAEKTPYYKSLMLLSNCRCWRSRRGGIQRQSPPARRPARRASQIPLGQRRISCPTNSWPQAKQQQQSRGIQGRHARRGPGPDQRPQRYPSRRVMGAHGRRPVVPVMERPNCGQPRPRKAGRHTRPAIRRCRVQPLSMCWCGPLGEAASARAPAVLQVHRKPSIHPPTTHCRPTLRSNWIGIEDRARRELLANMDKRVGPINFDLVGGNRQRIKRALWHLPSQQRLTRHWPAGMPSIQAQMGKRGCLCGWESGVRPPSKGASNGCWITTPVSRAPGSEEIRSHPKLI